MKKYYYCIDIGGTTIKGGIVDENNNIKSIESIHEEIMTIVNEFLENN